MIRTLILHPYIFIQIVTSLLGAMSFFLEGFNDAIGLQLCVCVCVRARAPESESVFMFGHRLSIIIFGHSIAPPPHPLTPMHTHAALVMTALLTSIAFKLVLAGPFCHTLLRSPHH